MENFIGIWRTGVDSFHDACPFSNRSNACHLERQGLKSMQINDGKESEEGKESNESHQEMMKTKREQPQSKETKAKDMDQNVTSPFDLFDFVSCDSV